MGKLLGQKTIQYFDENKAAFKMFEIDLKPSEEVDSLVMVFKNQKEQRPVCDEWRLGPIKLQ